MKVKVTLAFLFVCFFIACSFAYAQPLAGSWASETPDFDPGYWHMVLDNEDSNLKGSKFGAESEGVYLLHNLTLKKFRRIGKPRKHKMFYEYLIRYRGGTLTLYNDSGNSESVNLNGDGTDTPSSFTSKLKNTTQTVKKFVDSDGNLTGEIEFFMFTEGKVHKEPKVKLRFLGKYRG